MRTIRADVTPRHKIRTVAPLLAFMFQTWRLVTLAPLTSHYLGGNQSHNLCHLPESGSLPIASLEAKNRVSPQSLHTSTVNLADEKKVPSPGR